MRIALHAYESLCIAQPPRRALKRNEWPPARSHFRCFYEAAPSKKHKNKLKGGSAGALGTRVSSCSLCAQLYEFSAFVAQLVNHLRAACTLRPWRGHKSFERRYKSTRRTSRRFFASDFFCSGSFTACHLNINGSAELFIWSKNCFYYYIAIVVRKRL